MENNDFALPQIRMKDGGEHLYQLWTRIRQKEHAPEFARFEDFYTWAINRPDYAPNARMYKIELDQPYSPENCEFKSELWKVKSLEEAKVRKAIDDWNRAVNRIRVYFGMEPFPVSEEPNTAAGISVGENLDESIKEIPSE